MEDIKPIEDNMNDNVPTNAYDDTQDNNKIKK